MKEPVGTAGSVQVLQRQARILDCFSDGHPRLRASDVRGTTGLPASTVARILRSLVEEDLLQRHGDLYSIGLRVMAWSAAATAGSDLMAAAKPLADQLRDASGESCIVYVRQRTSRVAVICSISRQSIVYQGQIGQILPLAAGAAGKVFMAFDPQAHADAKAEGLPALTPHSITDESALARELESARAQGWTFSAEERELGLNSMAAPIIDSSGTLAAAIALGGPSFRLTQSRANELSERLVSCAERISEQLHWNSGPQTVVS